MTSVVLPLLLKHQKMKNNVRRQVGIYMMLEAVTKWFQDKNPFNLETEDDKCFVRNISLQKIIFSFEPRHPDREHDTACLAELFRTNKLPMKFVTNDIK